MRIEYLGDTVVEVVISERNAVALASKARAGNESAKTIGKMELIDDTGHSAANGRPVRLILRVEDNETHYANPARGEGVGIAGEMHPREEAFIAKVEAGEIVMNPDGAF